MNDQSIHRLYRHFRELPVSMRVLFSGALLVLGLGYLFAALYVFAAHSGADSKPGLSVEDIKVTYGGRAGTTQLELALQGPMSGMLPQQDLAKIIDWIHAGADKKAYTAGIAAIIDANCLSCHDGSNPHLANLDGFENIQLVVAQDTGADLFTLVRVSHIHLFGLTFIFYLVGTIFSHAYWRPVWLKASIVGLPFLCLALDVISWYLVKLYHPFAFVTMGAGAIQGLCFAFMWVVSMYQLWFSGTPDAVKRRHGVEEIAVG